ncbi:MAG: hypothetical protein ACREJ3_18530, partial [Polyangiaceae bacterium]
RLVAQDHSVDSAVSGIRASRVLGEMLDPSAIVSAVRSARTGYGGAWLARSLVELFSLVDWMAAVERRYRL